MQAPEFKIRHGQCFINENLIHRRTKVANDFAAALGGPRPSQSGVSQLFSDAIGNETIALTLPSLELEVKEKDSSILPSIGEHSELKGTEKAHPRPSMAASVFAKDTDNASNISNAEIAKSISRRTSWTKSTLAYSSMAVSSNLAQSFKVFTDSRLKAWTLVLLRHSLSTGSSQSRTKLLSMLSTKIQISADEATFKTLTLPESAQGLKPKDSDLVLPLLFEVSVKVSVQKSSSVVCLRCPGTISCTFGTTESDNCKLTLVNISLDSDIMMKNMIDQARLVVLRAVSSGQNEKNNTGTKKMDTPKAQSRDDSVFGAGTPSKSGSMGDIRALKAKSSALRLNRILQGKKAETPRSTPGKLKRGVEPRGLSLGPLAPVPKRQRLVQTAAKLTSFKSFGRPHAGDFGSGPRNATFGEFGGHNGSWGRNGRLAEHPQPLQLGATSHKNETFKTVDIRSSSSSAGFGRVSSQASGMVRTPTSLESSLMKKYMR